MQFRLRAQVLASYTSGWPTTLKKYTILHAVVCKFMLHPLYGPDNSALHQQRTHRMCSIARSLVIAGPRLSLNEVCLSSMVKQLQ